MNEKLRSRVRADIEPSPTLAALVAGSGRSIYGESDWKQFEAQSQMSKEASQFLPSDARLKRKAAKETITGPN